MFTVVTTKQKHQLPYRSSLPNVKTVGVRSLDALVSEAWDQIKIVSRDKLPDGPGWMTTNQIAAARGIAPRTARDLVKREQSKLEVFDGKIGNKSVAFYRPTSLAKIA